MYFCLGMMAARPPYGAGAMTSTGMFPMQQQGMMGNMVRPQNQYQTPSQTGSGSANDLKDIFG
jgi:hypothetical protein